MRRIVPTTSTRMTASITAYSAMSCPASSDHRLRINLDMHSPSGPLSVPRGRNGFEFTNDALGPSTLSNVGFWVGFWEFPEKTHPKLTVEKYSACVRSPCPLGPKLAAGQGIVRHSAYTAAPGWAGRRDKW